LRQLSQEYAGKREATGSENVRTGPFAVLRDAYMRMGDPMDLMGIESLEVNEDERHYTLMSLAGLLHDGQRDADEIADILCDVRDEYFVEGTRSVTTAEVRAIARYAVKQEPFDFEPYGLPTFCVWPMAFVSEEAMSRWIASNADQFAEDWDALESQNLPEQEVLIRLGDETMIREEMLAEIFAWRGLGKSMVVGSLIRILTKGGEFLG